MAAIKNLWILAIVCWVGSTVAAMSCVKPVGVLAPDEALKALELTCVDIVNNVKHDAPNPRIRAVRDACTKQWLEEYEKRAK